MTGFYGPIKRLLPTFLLIILSLSLTGCVHDEIKIDMLSQNGQPVFFFKYVKKPEVQIHSSSIQVHTYEPYEDFGSYGYRTDELIWEILSFDPSLIYEKKDGVRLLKKDWVTADIRSATIDNLVYGSIPEGFKQYYPEDNSLVSLEENKRYIISVVSGAGTGRMLFTLKGKCRQNSETPYSESDPDFNKDFDC